VNNSRRHKIGQFAPGVNKANYPGVLGWGFDTHGYRIVMYGPTEWDTSQTQDAIQNLKKHPSSLNDHTVEDTHTVKTNRQKRKIKRDAKKLTDDKRRDHGPAHVHVIHLQSGNESKFELIEHYEPGESFVRLLTNGNKNVLSEPQVNEVTDLLHPYAEKFIQRWREMYQDYGTSRYVARISQVGNKDIEHIPYKVKIAEGEKEIWLEVREKDGSITRIPPPNGAETPSRHADRIAKGKRKNPDIWDVLY
jgi:hypothetical protein